MSEKGRRMKHCPVCKILMSDNAEYCINGHKYNDMPEINTVLSNDFFSYLKKIVNETRKENQ